MLEYINQMRVNGHTVTEANQAWVEYTLAKRLSDRFGEHYLDESRDVLASRNLRSSMVKSR